jgi:aminopeptidase N
MKSTTRLIDFFIPEHYQLSIDLKRLERVFDGTVTITGTSQNFADKIILYAKDLTIHSVTFNGKEASFDAKENDELHISHPDLTNGSHIIVITFSGKISDQMHGLYPCYFEHDGIKKELLATQFESHHAREVFPCIDEPEAKAIFDLTLTTEEGIVVLGNMPVRQQVTENNRMITRFASSPRMSTYLLAWVVGELHRKTAETKSGVEVNVWATPAQSPESLDFALENAVQCIDFFDDYFGVPYPLPKSDNVALPDFSSGAMENWGLITYREAALIADPTTTSISSKHYIATVVAHELSHQWFGNLVTMKWWNDLWLNESFANIMEYVAIDALHPDWNVWLDFSTSEDISALRRDSIDGVQAVQVDVNHPDEINTLFDPSIVYAKGARLIRMLKNYIGDEAFQAGLKAYFVAHSYRNTEANDLWQAFATTSGKDVASFMNAWLMQSGYPVVSVSKQGNNVLLHQERFFVGPHANSSNLWPIPLDEANGSLSEIFSSRDLTAESSSQSLRLNSKGAAHFITKYSPELFKPLVEQIKNSELATVNRLQILHEQTLLARGGHISTAELIPLLHAYHNESTESVWDIMALTISELKKFVENNSESKQNLQTLVRIIARKEYQRLGWKIQPNEPETDTKMRATLIGLMIYAEDEETVQTAVELFNSINLTKLDPELRSLIISAKVRHDSSKELIDTLINEYKSTNSPDLQQDIGSALSCTKDPSVVSKLLEITKDASIVRPQDAIFWFVSLLRGSDSREAAWKWLRDNWKWVEETYGSDKSYDYFPRYAGSCLVTKQQLNEYREFFTPMLSEPSLNRVITMGISEIEGRVELLMRDTDAVRQALAEK